MSKTYRVAFAGAGGIVQWAHIPNFQRLANVETVALADVNEARAKSVAADKKVTTAYTDYRTMLEKEQPDIVVVASPNVFHKSMAMDALEAGAHVLCEKPLALNYDDSVELFAKAASKNRVLTVGTHYRFSDPMQMCKAHVDGNFFGRIYAARTTYCRRSGIPGYGSWFTNKDLAGGGVLFDLGVHALDRALYLMGYPKPVAVTGATFSELGTRGQGLGGWGQDILKPGPNTRFDVEDFSWAFVRFEDGTVLQFSVSWAAHFPDGMTVELYGTDGGAHIMASDKMELYTTLNGQNVTMQSPMPREAANSYRKLVENFVKYIDGDTTADIIQPQQALVGVQIVDAIQRSAASGREIVLV
ncbi:MAG: Gfo/Idh/MocA family oxidoreductase [Caldilineaceae bacterium]